MSISRRTFLISSGVVGGALVVGFSLSGDGEKAPYPIDVEDGAFVPNAFLQILPDNTVKFYTARDEMGQGVTTGLATLVGEELDYDPLDMDVGFAGVHADYNNPGMGMQMTGGSNAINAHYNQLREAGARTRALIVAAAAQDLGVAPGDVATDNGQVMVGGKRHPYANFIGTAAQLPVPDPETEVLTLKSADEFKYIGRESGRVDSIAKATGTADFGIDVDVPGMHYAVVVRSPVAGASLVSVDKVPAERMNGVTNVVEVTTGVAVVAKKYWQAKTAAAALEPSWSDVPLGQVDTGVLRADYEAELNNPESGLTPSEEGDLDTAFADAAEVVEAEYWTPFLAHAPMEPMNAVVRVGEGEAEVWSGTQSPSVTQGLVARVAELEPAQVKVHQTYLGGGFGRRGTLSHIMEAAEISQVSGKTVKLIWSREDDIRNGLYRPASLMRIKAGVDDGGQITSWDAKRVGGNITPDSIAAILPGAFPGMGDGTIDWVVGLAEGATTDWFADPTSVEGLYEDYDHANTRVVHATLDHGLPLTFWRSVGHSYTSFAKESMIDELAAATGRDEVELRLENTKNKPRLHNVIKVAAERMKTMRPAPGRHLGFAAHHSFKTDVAEIAEVSVEAGVIRVHKVTCVVDCGIAINPDIVRAQMEGGIVYGLTAALHSNLNLEAGAIRESNFHDYPILRMDEAPDVEVIIIDSGTHPTGVGEPGLPPVAPAVANAVFKATGQRLRSLPLRLA